MLAIPMKRAKCSERGDGVDLDERALRNVVAAKGTRAGLTEPMKVCAYTSSTSWKSSTFFM